MTRKKNIRRISLLFVVALTAFFVGCRAGAPVKTQNTSIEQIKDKPKLSDDNLSVFTALDDVTTLYNLSIAKQHLENGDTAKAANIFERITKLRTQGDERHCVDAFENCYVLAEIYKRNGQFDDAKRVYEKLNTEHPDICRHKSCATLIAYCEFKLGNMDNAVIALNSSPHAKREYSKEEAIERLNKLDEYFNEPD